MGTDICVCLHSMEIDFNKDEIIETSEEFVGFSIREYVAGIRKKDRKKCWPFGTLGDPDNDDVFASYRFPECRLFSSQLCLGDIDGSDYAPEYTNAPPGCMIESLGIEGKTVYDGKVNNARFPQENSVDKKARIGRTVAVDIDESMGRNRARKKARKFLLLSDILRDLAGPSGGLYVRCDITNPDNINSRFATETEDESDDTTLDAFFRKQTGFEVKKKKRKMIRVQEPRVDRDKRLKRGSKDSNENDSDVDPGKQKDSPSENGYAEVCRTTPTKTANDDSEMEAVMLLASHFNEENPPRPTIGAKNAQMALSVMRKTTETEPLETTKRNHDCACVYKKIRKGSTPDGNYESIRSSKTVTEDQGFCADTHKKFSKEKLEIRKMKGGGLERGAENRVNMACSINRNPADFSIANAENEFMRRG